MIYIYYLRDLPVPPFINVRVSFKIYFNSVVNVDVPPDRGRDRIAADVLVVRFVFRSVLEESVEEGEEREDDAMLKLYHRRRRGCGGGCGG